ncbi:histidine--tRNA ligase [Blochmannia endosymbiont of Camponotus sp. C-003]|uniref:histidine--tRNA ligase n=1 Tax=unclassified Candidatus Blochmanniella TaxID=711328 RepID=UPI0020245903|nr:MULTISPECIES: histidine--tRNA ligase [unclassified Candidatus Blochmannia]URJ23307.1 histidine--tRNA ligase [Blochmannia endosymbiont of Camponotus sp. C-003]URJ28780.1 histidine--tRNA ligase [Blochmannia endosymbiont of Camponotus sp. C-046]
MIKYHKNIQSVRGMHDYVPKDTILWQYIENTLITILNSYGYNEIRFPIIEDTNLFKRSIGEVTDVIEKEMYSFTDRNGKNLTLRPEGTSGCVRAGINHGLFYHQEQRLWYLGPMFRHERPQKGRYRQFHQFSAEAFGQIGPDIDAELILITARCWKKLGIHHHLSLELNSIGSLSSRIKYRKKLITFLEKNLSNLDNNALRRLYSNPMRILDTKNTKTKELLLNAPILNDHLDDDSHVHFSELCQLLNLLGISYTVNPYLVRGLDYYNKTVFEWVTDSLGVKKTICAGGRYDELVQELGGHSVPAIGFSIGLERIILLMQKINNNTFLNNNIYIDVYLISIGNHSRKYAMLLAENIRSKLPSVRLMVHHGGGNIKKQFYCANKHKPRIVLIMNAKNVLENTIVLENLQSKNQEILKHDAVTERLRHILDIK